MKPIDDAGVREAVTWLGRQHGLRLALLFGSAARDALYSDSDLDVAVLATRPLTAEAKRALIEGLARASGRAVDLVDLSTVGEPLLGRILADGRQRRALRRAGRTRSLRESGLPPVSAAHPRRTEAEVDRAVIDRKLESLRRCLQRVEDRRPATLEALLGDADAQDILSLNLTRAVQLCVDIAAHVLADEDVPAPETMGGTFVALAAAGVLDTELAWRMRAAVGFRTVAIHSYQEIDWAIVFAIARERLGDFERFARAVVDRLEG
ncbi:MAG: HepT-like ribonuclease domain-containing protein [Pseudomonadales bacterium]|jgi:uncharacterized protein YutE (UPF0331/DUF86 family)/predicted nucleotidyltransferase|nr:HepT-like ribonuclease domain-containing protein [Pseudomonadales bacterium]